MVFSSRVRSPSGVFVGKNSNEITGRRVRPASAKMSRMNGMCRYPIAMRIITCLVLVLCGAPAAHAQAPLEWSPERRLTKADFQGRTPPQAVNASLSYLHIEASWECVIGELFATARATFDPSRSWWRTMYGNVWGSAGDRTSASRTQMAARRNVMVLDAQLLDHEQLHFDIAELAARRMRARFEGLREACAEPDGTGKIQAMVQEVDRELQEEQSRYDRETSHGANMRAQDQWKRRIRALFD